MAPTSPTTVNLPAMVPALYQRADETLDWSKFLAILQETINDILGGVSALPPLLLPFDQTVGLLVPGTYAYRVSALTSSGETLASDEQDFMLTADGGIQINWQGVPGILGYKIYGRTSGMEQLLAQVGALATSFIDDGTLSLSGALPTGWPTRSFLDCAPLANGDFDAILEAVDEGAAGNTISVALVNSGIIPDLSTPPPTGLAGVTVPFTGALQPNTYYYRVTAVTTGETQPCAELAVVVPLRELRSDQDPYESITLTWNAVPGAGSYKIYGRTQGSEQLLATVGGLTFTDDGTLYPLGVLPTPDGSNCVTDFGTRTVTLYYSHASGTTVGQVEAALAGEVLGAGLSPLIRVRSPGTVATALIFDTDGFAATPLKGASPAGFNLSKISIDAMTDAWDPLRAEARLLPYIAQKFGWEMDAETPTALQRKILSFVIQIHKEKGTKQGILDVLNLYLGAESQYFDLWGDAWQLGYDQLGEDTILGCDLTEPGWSRALLDATGLGVSSFANNDGLIGPAAWLEHQYEIGVTAPLNGTSAIAFMDAPVPGLLPNQFYFLVPGVSGAYYRFEFKSDAFYVATTRASAQLQAPAGVTIGGVVTIDVSGADPATGAPTVATAIKTALNAQHSAGVLGFTTFQSDAEATNGAQLVLIQDAVGAAGNLPIYSGAATQTASGSFTYEPGPLSLSLGNSGGPSPAAQYGFYGGLSAQPLGLAVVAGSGTLAIGTYYYRVTAATAFGETAPSTEMSVTLGSTGGAQLSWDAVSGATGYRVYGRAMGAEEFIAEVTATTLSYLDNGSILPAAAVPAVYVPTGGFVAILLVNAISDEEIAERIARVLAFDVPLLAGHSFGLDVVRAGTQIQMRWNAKGTVGDGLLTGAAAAKLGIAIAAPAISSIVSATGTLGAGTYAYRVSSFNGRGETLAGPSTDVTLTANHGALLTWALVNGATGYRIYGRTSANEQLLAEVGAAASTYTDDGSLEPYGPLPLVNSSGTFGMIGGVAPNILLRTFTVTFPYHLTDDELRLATGLIQFMKRADTHFILINPPANVEPYLVLNGEGSHLGYDQITRYAPLNAEVGVGDWESDRLTRYLGGGRVVTLDPTTSHRTLKLDIGARYLISPDDDVYLRQGNRNVTACGALAGTGATLSSVYGNIATPSTPTLAYGIGSLAPGRYSYAVTALNAQGETTASPVVSIVLGATGGVYLSWSAVTGATAYNIYGRSSLPFHQFFLAQVASTTLSFTDTGDLAPTSAVPPTVNATTMLMTLTGVTGITPNHVGHLIALSAEEPANTGTFVVASYLGTGSIQVFNPTAIYPDSPAGHVDWSIQGDFELAGTRRWIVTPTDELSAYVAVLRQAAGPTAYLRYCKISDSI